MTDYRNDSPIAVLSGGVGGARMTRGFAAICSRLTVVVNVGDDDLVHGVWVSPDLDTVMYSLAGMEGPHGWGVSEDSFTVMDRIDALGGDTRFRIGDRDLATNLLRTAWRQEGMPLSEITRRLTTALEVRAHVTPVSDDPIPTRVRSGNEWMAFQDYFVLRRHADPVDEVRYEGATASSPAPGVIEAIEGASVVVIAPSNPPLSIWPMLAVPGIRAAIQAAPRVVAVSPLFGGSALKGPAADVMRRLGLPPGNEGVAEAYDGLITDLIVDEADGGEELATPARVHAHPTRVARPQAAAALAKIILELS
ncbi:MAG: 2-phospho-L-lactate transferase [Acidimicrobiia bacterium]|nr:2-phospho-L-lactate transferase [Acidimicrobiia bacterium]